MSSAADTFVTVVGLGVSALGALLVVTFVAVRFYELLVAMVYSAEARLRRLRKELKVDEEEVVTSTEELLA